MQIAALLLLLLLPGCMGRWVYQEPVLPVAGCVGGRVDQTRRITESGIGGRVRNVTTTTSSCFD